MLWPGPHWPVFNFSLSVFYCRRRRGGLDHPLVLAALGGALEGQAGLEALLQQEGGVASGAGHGHRAVPEGEIALGIGGAALALIRNSASRQGAKIAKTSPQNLGTEGPRSTGPGRGNARWTVP